ncbi:MAG: LacI family DNA-binding transcriptional regulator [Lachnospiraceae bacterium]|nr:LacI family DNA-binding transcriptional regulator [Lachnospiraceae bacterium]
MKKVTIIEIANEMGLSRNTVAKALSDSAEVAEATKKSVAKKAVSMGYTKIADSVLALLDKETKSETKTIAVVNRYEISVFWNRIIMGMSDELQKAGYKLQIVFIDTEDEEAGIIPKDTLEKVEGLLVLSVFSDQVMSKLDSLGIPAVYLDMACDYKVRPKHGDFIMCEGESSVAELTTCMIEQGMKKIGFIGDITSCVTNRERFNGYHNALLQAGITLDKGIVVTNHVPFRYYVASETEKALESFEYMPEAIICANDDIAWFAIKYLRKKGYRVPEDVAITGFDNIEEIAPIEAFLTTVRVGNYRLGRKMVQQLIWRMDNKDFPMETVRVGVDIIYRISSCKNAQEMTN